MQDNGIMSLNMKRVFVLHILPLEFYPPVTNFLNILSKEPGVAAKVYSTHNNKDRREYFVPGIKIFRSNYPSYIKRKSEKLWAFLVMVVGPLLQMLLYKPHSVLYYEPHSAFSVYLYKKFFNRKVNVFIHYHEYYSPEEFLGEGMSWVNYFHKKEVAFLYKKAVWISQTNTSRLSYFKKDHPDIEKEKLRTLANYPPKSWSNINFKEENPLSKLRLLYIGALSFENTYIKEILDFVLKHPTKVTLDIYSFNTKKEVSSYIKAMSVENITYYDKGIDYNRIPEMAVNYDVGLVLYKGHNLNYIYNAPNKLFEYLACGLSVWVPKNLLGCAPYLNDSTKPAVIQVDYVGLPQELLLKSKALADLPFYSSPYNDEDELKTIITFLKQVS